MVRFYAAFGMASEQFRIGEELFRNAQGLTFKAREPVERVVDLFAAGRESLREADDEAVVDPHQAAVEGPVVQSVQAEAVAHVEAVRRIFGPRDDVARNE